MEEKNIEKLKNFLDSYLNMGVPGFDCLVKEHGKTVLRYQGGYIDLENKIRFSGNERFNMYSASKVVTCAALMQLWEKGAFSLDENVSRYLPEFKDMTVMTEKGIEKCRKPIKIENLFTMTSGINYNLETEWIQQTKKDTNGKCPTREIIKCIAREPLSFEPGKLWQYGLSHDVLAGLLEVLTGEKFGEYCKKNIFMPLGMDNTTFSLPESELDTIAPQYVFSDETKRPELTSKNIRRFKVGSEYESGGAGIISTVEDYMKFLESLRIGNIILKKETVDLMQQDRLNDEQKTTYWNKQYGYGLGVRCHMKKYRPWDFGWAGAAGVFLAVNRERDYSIFVAQHVLNPPNNNIKGWVTSIFENGNEEMLTTHPLEDDVERKLVQ